MLQKELYDLAPLTFVQNRGNLEAHTLARTIKVKEGLAVAVRDGARDGGPWRQRVRGHGRRRMTDARGRAMEIREIYGCRHIAR